MTHAEATLAHWSGLDWRVGESSMLAATKGYVWLGADAPDRELTRFGAAIFIASDFRAAQAYAIPRRLPLAAGLASAFAPATGGRGRLGVS